MDPTLTTEGPAISRLSSDRGRSGDSRRTEKPFATEMELREDLSRLRERLRSELEIPPLERTPENSIKDALETAYANAFVAAIQTGIVGKFDVVDEATRGVLGVIGGKMEEKHIESFLDGPPRNGAFPVYVDLVMSGQIDKARAMYPHFSEEEMAKHLGSARFTDSVELNWAPVEGESLGESVAQGLAEVLDPEKSRFRRIDENGQVVRGYPGRMNPENVELLDLNGDVDDVKDKILVIEVKADEFGDEQAKKCYDLLGRNISLVLAVDNGDGNPPTMQIIQNHSDCDGVHVGAILSEMPDQYGRQMKSFKSIHRYENTKEGSEAKLERRRKSGERFNKIHGSDLEKSFVVGEETTAEISQAYIAFLENIRETMGVNGLYEASKILSYSSFIQHLVIESAGFDGKKNKGAALMYNQSAKTDLDLISKTRKLETALEKMAELRNLPPSKVAKRDQLTSEIKDICDVFGGERKRLNKKGELVSDRHSPRSLISGIVGEAAQKITDPRKRAEVASSTLRMGITRKLTPQIQTSAIPDSYTPQINGDKGLSQVEIHSNGGPAGLDMTERQFTMISESSAWMESTRWAFGGQESEQHAPSVHVEMVMKHLGIAPTGDQEKDKENLRIAFAKADASKQKDIEVFIGLPARININAKYL